MISSDSLFQLFITLVSSMSPHELVCIVCGKPLPDGDEGVVCHHCLEKQVEEKEDFLIFPEMVSVTVCKHCLAHKKGKKRWEPPKELEDSMAEEVMSSLMKGDGVEILKLELGFEPLTKRQFRTTISGLFAYHGGEGERDYQLVTAVKYEVCEVCSRKFGNYFEAILQLRRDRKLSEEQIQELAKQVVDFVDKEKEKDWHSFISKMGEVHGGLDFYLSSSSLAQKLATHLLNHLGGEIKTSSSLVSRREGRNLYRTTHCLRLPPVEDGDVVRWLSPHHKKEQIFLVRTVSKRGAKVVELCTHQEEFLDKRHFPELELNGREQVRFDAIVLFSEKDEFRVMDPESYQPTTILKPYPSFEVQAGEIVPILKTDFGVFVDCSIECSESGK